MTILLKHLRPARSSVSGRIYPTTTLTLKTGKKLHRKPQAAQGGKIRDLM